MISTEKTRSVQLDIEPWFALISFHQANQGAMAAALLFTRPEYLEARLKMQGKAAFIAARQFAAAMSVIKESAINPLTGKPLPSRLD